MNDNKRADRSPDKMTIKTVFVPSVEQLHKAANHAVELGYNVIKLIPGTKDPAHKWKEEATNESEIVDSWFTDGKPWNYGIVTTGLCVVDVDIKEDRPINEWYEANAERLMDSPAIQTPRGGTHFYFQQQEGLQLRNTTGTLNKGIANHVDTRADGGYIVGPGSVVNGKPYQALPYRQLEAKNSLPVVPEFVLEALDKSNRRTIENPSTCTDKVFEGSRNATLTSLAGKMRRGGFKYKAINAAIQAINENYSPPLDCDEVSRIATSVARYPANETEENKPLRWQPFPVDCLPERLAEFVNETAKSKVVDPAMVAMPLLAALAGAIGGSRRVLIKPDWPEPCILWAALVSPSGSGKTPAAKPVLAAIRDRDATAVMTNDRLMSEHHADVKEYERAMKSKKEPSEPIQEPTRPQLIRYHLQDVTPEQLLSVLEENPRGVLIVRDELSGLFGGFGQYSDGKAAAERGKYLSIWSSEHLSDDRKMAKCAYARNPHASIYGGIQPDLLFRSIGDNDIAAGLPARFLFAWPPEQPRLWSDGSVPSSLTKELASVFDRLFELELVEVKITDGLFEHTDHVAKDLPLTGEAQAIFKQWHDDICAPLVSNATGGLRAAYAKLAGYAGRLALVLQLASWAIGDKASEEHIDEISMRKAIELVEWFANEAARVYGLHTESEAERDQRKLIEWILGQDGGVTIRDLARGPRQYREAGKAEESLEKLVRLGYGTWQLEDHRGGKGRPTRKFQLINSGDGDTITMNFEANPISVTVASA